MDLGPDLTRTAFASPDGSVREGPCALPHQSLELLLEKARHELGHDFREVVLAIPWGAPRPATAFQVVRHMFRPVAALTACPRVGPSVVVIEAHSQGWRQTRWRDQDGVWELDQSFEPPDQVLVVDCNSQDKRTVEYLKAVAAPVHFPERPEWTVVRGAALFAIRLCGNSPTDFSIADATPPSRRPSCPTTCP